MSNVLTLGQSIITRLVAQLTTLQVNHVQVGDLDLTPHGGLEAGSNLRHLIIVEIDPWDSISTARLFGLFFDAQRSACLIELDHTIAFRVAHRVGKDERTLVKFGSLA